MKVMRSILSVVALATLIGAGSAGAQDTNRRDIERRLRELREEMRELERQLGGSADWNVMTYSGLPRVLALSSSRAQLGVYVQQQADEETDAIGAVLSGVVDGGPADEAGLQEGDIITSFDGEQLAGRYPAARRGESEPAKKLIDLVAGMDPGDEVTIGYRRDGQDRTTTVTLEDRSPLLSVGRSVEVPWVESPSPRVAIRSVGPEGNILTILRGGIWADIELVALNEELGRYFGTNDGLLVIQAPDGVDLQGGDVILNINGREARTPSRALRILQSYEPGETANVEIMRDRRRMTVTITVPERQDPERGSWEGLWERRY